MTIIVKPKTDENGVPRCLWCGKPIPDWFEKELELKGCRYYCSKECCRAHWRFCYGDDDYPECPCF